jgi:hypothetical protein
MEGRNQNHAVVGAGNPQKSYRPEDVLDAMKEYCRQHDCPCYFYLDHCLGVNRFPKGSLKDPDVIRELNEAHYL